MATIEYTQSKNEYLMTGCTDGHSDITNLRFSPAINGILYIGEESFKVTDGRAIIRSIELNDGVHTPILRTDEGSFICDRIKCEGGCIGPKKDDMERTFFLTKKIISDGSRIEALERALLRLTDAVYGKSIF